MPATDALRDCSNAASQSSIMENSSQQQRKRAASPLLLNQQGSSKRSKLLHGHDDTTVTLEPTCQDQQNSTHETLQETIPHDFSSVTSLLSVPLEILFRQVPGSASQQKRRKPLLTRAEAQCLIKTTQLASQVDLIVEVSSKALSHKLWCTSFGESIAGVPLLRSILPLLAIHGTQISSRTLTHVQGDLDRVLHDLETCAGALTQYSEQNWTLSESLLDAFGGGATPSSGNDLAKEKRMLAEMQEEVCARIDALLKMSSFDEKEEEENVFEMFKESGQFVSMPQFCNRLFGIDTTNADTTNAVQQEKSGAVQEEKGGIVQQEGHYNDDKTPRVCNQNDKEENPRHEEIVVAVAETASAVQQETVAMAAQEEENEQEDNDKTPQVPNGNDPTNEQKEEPTNNPLLALAQEAEERAHQWSASTVTIPSPERSRSPMDDEEEEDFGEMTQGTSNAVAALTVLASGGRGDRMMNQGGE